jgi:hypothetical protein
MAAQVSIAFSKRLIQLCFEPQELRYLFAHTSDFGLEQVSHLRTRVIVFLIEDGQLLDFGQRKAQFLSVLYKDEVFHVRVSEKAETAFTARWLLDQSDLLVEADRINAQSGPLRNLADLNALRHATDHPDNDSIDTGVISRVKTFELERKPFCVNPGRFRRLAPSVRESALH